MKIQSSNFFKNLLPVNFHAGRLRFILASLIIIIFWTLIAQTLPESNLVIFTNGGNSGFTGNILEELISRYFSPITFFFTIIPLIILRITNLQVNSIFLKMFPDLMDDKRTQRYLKTCAFSQQRNKLHLNAKSISDKNNENLFLKRIGGPAELTVDNNLLLLIESHEKKDITLVQPKITNGIYKVPLLWKQFIFEFVPKKILHFPLEIKGLKSISVFEGYKPLYYLDIVLPDGEIINTLYSVKPISKADANFLKLLTKNEHYIPTLITNEIKKYLLRQVENLEIPTEEKEINSFSNKVMKQQKTHKNYSNINKSDKMIGKGFTRTHKRSLYGMYAESNVPIANKDTSEGNILSSIDLNDLNSYIQGQVVSFFNTKNIQINIQKGN